MPKRSSPNGAAEPPKKKAAKKGAARIAANGYRLPDSLPPGELLTDVTKKQWRLGNSVGLGGFGEIYLASDNITKTVGADAAYVVKIEPHTNGPLFTEMNFYHRVGKAEQIMAWVEKRKLDYLGMPQFHCSGSHMYKGLKYRFMVMDRFGEDLQKILERSGKIFPLKTVFTLGIRVIDVLEYVHSFGYIHADVKASNLLLGYGKANENKVYLVDFGLACRYTQNGKHKEYKEDLRKAHDGTIEFTSRDAHIGAHSRRGDLEILGYNMLQWLCGRLPWEENLKDPEYVSQQKCGFMQNIPHLMSKCFPDKNVPSGISEYMQYVARMKFEDNPDYNRLRNILIQGVRASGQRHNCCLEFTAQPTASPKRPAATTAAAKRKLKAAAAAAMILASDSSIEESEETPPVRSPAAQRKRPSPAVRKSSRKPSPAKASCSSAFEPKPAKQRQASGRSTGSRTNSKESRKNGFSEDSNSMGMDNPTPAMLQVLQRRQELLALQLQQDSAAPSRGSSSKQSSTSPHAHSPSPPLRNGHVMLTKDRAVQTVRVGRQPLKPRVRPVCSTASQTSSTYDGDLDSGEGFGMEV